MPPPPDKKKVLYDAISKEYDLGSYAQFQQKLADPAKRKVLYGAVGKDYDLGDYNTFESKLGFGGGGQKQPSIPQIQYPAGQIANAGGLIQPEGTFKKEQPAAFDFKGYLQGQPQETKSSTVNKAGVNIGVKVGKTSKPNPVDYIWKDKEGAINKALDKKNKGFAVSPEGQEVQRKSIEQQIENGDLVVHKNEKGESELKRGGGFWDMLLPSVNATYQEELDNSYFAGLSKEDKIRRLNLERESPEQFNFRDIEPNGKLGEIGKFIGDNAGLVAKGGAATMAATVALPEAIGSGGMANFLSMFKQFGEQGYKNNYARTFNNLKNQGVPDSEAADEAHKAGLAGEVTQMAVGGVLSHTGGKLAIPEDVANSAWKSLTKASGGLLLKDAPKLAIASGAGAIAEGLSRKGVGSNESDLDILKEAGEATKSGYMTGLAFGIPHVIPHLVSAAYSAVLNPKSVISPLRAQLDNVLASMKQEERQQISMQAEESGIAPEGFAEAVEQKARDFSQAKAPYVALPISEEKKAAMAGKDLQISKAKTPEEAEQLGKEKAAIFNANHPFEIEKDSDTGEKVGTKPSVIMPDEMNRPSETTIAPDETLLPETKQSAVSVTLPQSRAEPNIVPLTKEGTVSEAKPDLIKQAQESVDEINKMYRQPFLEDTENSLKEIAQQLNSSEAEAATTRKTFGDKISDIALELYPDEKVEVKPILINEPTPIDANSGTTAEASDIKATSEPATKEPIIEEVAQGNIDGTKPSDAKVTTPVLSEGEPPAKVPPTKEVTTKPEGDDEWTAIRQSKLKEIDRVAKLFEKEHNTTFPEIQRQALEAVAEEHPEKSLYEAVRAKTIEIAAKYDNKVDYNPTAKDLAVIQEFKRQTEKRVSQVKDRLSSDDDIVRQTAVLEMDGLSGDLETAAKALHKREAGTAFGFRQSESKFDSDYGLQIRRMQLIKSQHGEKLTPEQEKWTSEQWAKEKEIYQKEQDLREQGMQQAFDEKVAAITKEYEDKLKQAGTDAPSGKSKKTSDKLRNLANKIKNSKKLDDLGLGDPIEGSAQGATFNVKNALVKALELMADGIDKVEAIAQALKEHGGVASKEFADLVDRAIAKASLPDINETIESIKEYAKENNLTDVTKEMVGEGLIRDLVHAHIGEVEQKEVLNAVTKKLQEVLPDVTKKNLIEAFLKEGEFRQETKRDLEGSLESKKRELQNIAKLEEDIADLEGYKSIRERNFSNTRERSAYEKELMDKKRGILKDRAEAKAKFDKEYRDLETERNRQLRRVAELKEKKSKLEKGIREVRKANQKKLDTPEIEDLKKQVKEVDAALRKSESETKRIAREQQERKDKIDEINANVARVKKGMEQIKTHKNKPAEKIDEELDSKRRELRKAIQEHSTDEQLQAKKLENVKKKTVNEIKELKRKIAEGDYAEPPVPTSLKHVDAELIRLQKEHGQLEAIYRQKQHELEESSKSNAERLAGFARNIYVTALIGHPKTLAKVGAMAIMRPFSEAATKATFGKVFDAFFPNISKAAKVGGESNSIRSIASGFGAYFKQMGEAKVKAKIEESNNALKLAGEKYIAYEKRADADPKELARLKREVENRQLDVMGNLVYEFIGGSSIKDSMKALVHRANIVEQKFGGIEEESIRGAEFDPSKSVAKQALWAELNEFSYVMNFIGRSHSALKTFSGRFSFAAGFMARAEAAVRKGELLTSDRLLEMGHESYLDFERGKYQQENAITRWWNRMVNSTLLPDTKHPEWSRTNKILYQFTKGDVAITRVPVNIFHEAVMEYTLGTFRALKMAAKEVGLAKKAAELEGLEKGEFTARVKEIVSTMDAKQAATIVRCFRKGGLGLGMYALALISGMVHFGGYQFLGQRKKKEEDALGKDELNPAQVELGGHKFGEVSSGIIEHIPALWPMFMGTGMAYTYKMEVDKGKMSYDAALKTAYNHLKVMEGSIPQFKVISPLRVATGIAKVSDKRLTEMGLIDEDEPTTKKHTRSTTRKTRHTRN